MFVPHFTPFGNKKKSGKHEEKINEIYKIEIKIQELLNNKMGRLVHKARAGGIGMSNNGNTSRRFFKNCQGSARITCVIENLILRFYIIMQSI